jgi:hypothetical protein
MTDRERLIELHTKAHTEWLQKEYDHETDKSIAEYVADYLLANGVIVPPCKVGDAVYAVGMITGQVIPSEVVGIEHTENDMFLILANQTVVSTVYQLGKTVFLTKEEAEEKLKEREG